MDEKSIRNILMGERLVVPEIQRDYVWGDEKNVSKLLAFVSDLQAGLKVGKKNIGFMYSYLAHKSEHYIIDGQQRFTSIILLLYVLANKENRLADFQRLLKVDEPTMMFCYNVRPLTEQFLPLLFKEVYPADDSIQDKIWYISAYDSDMTIRSILNAVKNLYHQDYSCTYDDILEKVHFWYFDVAQTSQGEELYISMNSRGQKLVDHEQIKPRLFDKLGGDTKLIRDFGLNWDNWEEEFYSKKPEKATISAVDVAMNNFLQNVIELCLLENVSSIDPVKHVDSISLEVLQEHFHIMQDLQDKGFDVFLPLYDMGRSRSTIFLSEALLVGYKLFNGDVRELNRLTRTINNILTYTPNASYKDFYQFISLISKSQAPSFFDKVVEHASSLVHKEDGSGFIPKREYQKIEALSNKLISEELIVEAEHFAFLDGRIHFLYQDEFGNPDWDRFVSKYEHFKLFFDTNGVSATYRDNKLLLRYFVSLFHDTSMLWGLDYDDNKSTWQHILLDGKWKSCVHKLLLSDDMSVSDFVTPFDGYIGQVHQDLVSSNILLDVWEGCHLNWRGERVVLYPTNTKAEWKKYIMCDFRNKYLPSLLDEHKDSMSLLNKEQLLVRSSRFWGWNVCFEYKGQTFVWTDHDNVKPINKNNWSVVMINNKEPRYKVSDESIGGLLQYMDNIIEQIAEINK